MSRPLKKIDWQKVQEMLEAQCLGTEIAAYFGMHPDTFYRRVEEEQGMGFTEFSTQKKDIGKSKVRQAQYKSAVDGNTSAQVWWGKNYLGKRDNPISNVEFNKDLAKILDDLRDKPISDKICDELDKTPYPPKYYEKDAA